MSNKTPLLKNLLKELVVHERIKTTQAKAMRLRSLADRVVSFAKKGPASRHYLQSYLPDRLIEKLINKIAAGFKDRVSGFTRIIKIGRRKGDNAPMVLMEFVERKKVVVSQLVSSEGIVKRRTKTTTGLAATTKTKTQTRKKDE